MMQTVTICAGSKGMPRGEIIVLCILSPKINLLNCTRRLYPKLFKCLRQRYHIYTDRTFELETLTVTVAPKSRNFVWEAAKKLLFLVAGH